MSNIKSDKDIASDRLDDARARKTAAMDCLDSEDEESIANFVEANQEVAALKKAMINKK